MKVNITQSQILRAKQLATLRNRNKTESSNKKFSSHSNSYTHYIGVLAEIIFSDLTGLPVDENEYISGDDCDFVYKGLTIDVKSRLWRKGKIDLAIIEDNPESLKCDVYVLAIIDGNSVDFRGFVSKVDFAMNGKRVKMKDWRWGISCEYLRDIDELIGWVKG